MEGEVKEARQREDRLQVIPEIEQLIFQNMQSNHQPDSDRRRLSLENLPGLNDMSCTQLLALATSSSVGAASIPSYVADSQISMDSWVNTCNMESNPGTSNGTNAGETTMAKPQCDVSSSQKFCCDLNLTPEEMASTRPQPTEPELCPITLDTPGKRLPETDQEPMKEKKTVLETGTPAGAKKGKRARDEKAAQLKTPAQIQKKKKIRPKVIREGNAKKKRSSAAVKKAPAATAAPATKRSTRRSIKFDDDDDVQEEETTPWLLFENIPRKRRSSMKRKKISQNNHSKVVRKRRSLTVTRARSFLTLNRLLEAVCPPDLRVTVTRMHPGVPRRKGRNRDAIASKLSSKAFYLRWLRYSFRGTSSRMETWEEKKSVDSMTRLLEDLDINVEGPCVPQNRETAVILHQKAMQELSAMVRYGLIPDEKTYQTKVDLDDESIRVWKFLKASVDSEGVDGLDDKKKKWWQEERNKFEGLANYFIARMHLVLGDRRFSPWKGSVVDSVVGVFLTQAVTDHSSSSAFMNIAAAFPPKLNSKQGSSHEEWGSSVTDEETPRICNQVCIIEEIDDDDDEYEETSDSSVNITKKSKTVLLDPPTNCLELETQSYLGIYMVPSTSGSGELNLNEAPVEVVNSDEFRNSVDEGGLVHPMRNRQEELKSTTLHAQDQEKKTRTDMKDMEKKRKKPTTFKRKDQPGKNKPKKSVDWDSLRKEAQSGGKKRERTERTMDAVDWDAVRSASVKEIAGLIEKRGIHNKLAQNIKGFLDRLVRDHGSIDLEWLRDVPPDKTKEYLLNIHGLGPKSVDCVRLLSLHQVAFPVDTNVGRIAVRLGWVPLEPLPDELQMHLLEMYPILESVQKYLWPRLCKLDQKTLYELHYHMITFGKVFCTKVKPNCKACPMKAECRHYASARASAQRALPEPEERAGVMIHERIDNSKPVVVNFRQPLFLTQDKAHGPIIEQPTTPESECAEYDIEDYPWDNNDERDPWENNDVIPIIMLNKEGGTSKDLVLLGPQPTSIPIQKIKIKEKLRTKHLVYELPDSHLILKGFDRRDPDDTLPYLLATWTPANSSQPSKQKCVAQESEILCHKMTCCSCNNKREDRPKRVQGTILIPCRTAMKGSFPLNGTYFQINEVFADHVTSTNPIDVLEENIENLPISIAYFGSSVTAICKGLPVEDIRYSFQKGFICVRGFKREDRKPKRLAKRFHYSPNQQKTKRQ